MKKTSLAATAEAAPSGNAGGDIKEKLAQSMA
jgi:hypothetical protein